MERIENVTEDVEVTFRYEADKSYQERAHDYIERRGISRSARDTAVQCTVRDLVERAYACGVEDGSAGSLSEVSKTRETAIRLAGISADLFDQARALMECIGGDVE